MDGLFFVQITIELRTAKKTIALRKKLFESDDA